MIRATDELARFERRMARERARSFDEALAVFTALWVEASALRADFPGPWQDDLEADLAVARMVNHDEAP